MALEGVLLAPAALEPAPAPGHHPAVGPGAAEHEDAHQQGHGRRDPGQVGEAAQYEGELESQGRQRHRRLGEGGHVVGEQGRQAGGAEGLQLLQGGAEDAVREAQAQVENGALAEGGQGQLGRGPGKRHEEAEAGVGQGEPWPRRHTGNHGAMDQGDQGESREAVGQPRGEADENRAAGAPQEQGQEPPQVCSPESATTRPSSSRTSRSAAS